MRGYSKRLRFISVLLVTVTLLSLAGPFSFAFDSYDISLGASENALKMDAKMKSALTSSHVISVSRGAPADWAIKELSMADELGLVPSSVSDYFHEATTRLQFAELVINTISVCSGYSSSSLRALASGGKRFNDTSDSNVRACSYLGIIDGYPDGSFKPYASITRQEAAKMLNQMGSVLGFYTNNTPFSFNDIYGLWGEFYIEMISASENPYNDKAVMNGVGGRKFDPNGTYDRQQAVITMYRLAGAVAGFYSGEGASVKVQPGKYVCNLEPNYANPYIEIYSDFTFKFTVNLYEGMGIATGTYRYGGDYLDFRVTSRNFEGFLGDDVDYFSFMPKNTTLIYIGDYIGVTEDGDVFRLNK